MCPTYDSIDDIDNYDIDNNDIDNNVIDSNHINNNHNSLTSWILYGRYNGNSHVHLRPHTGR